jgi:hypothetical protein
VNSAAGTPEVNSALNLGLTSGRARPGSVEKRDDELALFKNSAVFGRSRQTLRESLNALNQ